MRFALPLAAALGLTACGPTIPKPANLCADNSSRCISAPARDVVAVDGDTYELQRLTDRGTERIRLRIIGWDSPESGDTAFCPAEDALGQQVETRVKEIVAAGKTITFRPESTDRFGRTRAHIYLDGESVGWLLAKEGLAAPWPADSSKPNWCQ